MLSSILTIVIPSKNESHGLHACLEHISGQTGILGTRVVIADSSDEASSLHWLDRCRVDFPSLEVSVIQGGFPAQARLQGSRLATTERLLFLDADIMLLDPSLLVEALWVDRELVTVRFQTERGWNWLYRAFDLCQWLSVRLGTPFALGGFQLFQTEAYWRIGGYQAEELFAEDYSLSSKISGREFAVLRGPMAWTSARRFRSKGVWPMFRLMVLGYLNRRNPAFFKSHHNYWT